MLPLVRRLLSLRRPQAEQDQDVLTFHNERLTKLTQSLQAELSTLVRRATCPVVALHATLAHQPVRVPRRGLALRRSRAQNAERGSAWLGGISRKEHQRVRDELDVVTTDLNAKIIENGACHATRASLAPSSMPD